MPRGSLFFLNYKKNFKNKKKQKTENTRFVYFLFVPISVASEDQCAHILARVKIHQMIFGATIPEGNKVFFDLSDFLIIQGS